MGGGSSQRCFPKLLPHIPLICLISRYWCVTASCFSQFRYVFLPKNGLGAFSCPQIENCNVKTYRPVISSDDDNNARRTPMTVTTTIQSPFPVANSASSKRSLSVNVASHYTLSSKLLRKFITGLSVLLRHCRLIVDSAVSIGFWT